MRIKKKAFLLGFLIACSALIKAPTPSYALGGCINCSGGFCVSEMAGITGECFVHCEMGFCTCVAEGDFCFKI